MITLHAPFVGLGLTPSTVLNILDLGQCQAQVPVPLSYGYEVKINFVGIPVILVAGFSQAARHRVIRDALNKSGLSRAKADPSRRGQVGRVAWLDHQDSLVRAPQCQLQPDQSFVACVCCAGSLVFTTHLGRMLRQGPWVGLMISLGARAEPTRMLRLLGFAPWSEHLGPIRLFSVMDETALALCEQEDHHLHQIALQQKTSAEQVLQPGESLPNDLFGLGQQT